MKLFLLDMDKAEAELQVLVQEGIDSGPATEMTREDFEQIRREMHAKHGRKGELSAISRRAFGTDNECRPGVRFSSA